MKNIVLFISLLALFNFQWDLFDIFSMENIKLRKGNQYYNNKQYDKATEQYTDILKSNPKNEKAMFNLANTYLDSSQPEKAHELYEKLQYNAKDKTIKESSYYNEGNLLFSENKFSEAIEKYRSALKLNPEDKEAKHNMELAIKSKDNQQNKQSENSSQQNKKSGKNKDKDSKGKDQKGDNKNNSNKNSSGDQKKDNEGNGSEQQAQQQKGKLSKEEAERILRTLGNKDHISGNYKQFSGGQGAPDKNW